MTKFLKCLGYLWASPITIFGLVYALLMQVAGWYNWHGVEGDALVWVVKTDKSPSWLLKLWDGWGGHTVGNVVVLRDVPDAKHIILTHEQKHVDQCMRLGIFQPVIYALIYVGLKLGCPGSHPYYSNSMEVDARRAAGQIIDVEGTLRRIRDQQNQAKGK